MTIRAALTLAAGVLALAACSPKPADVGSNEILPSTETATDAAPAGDPSPFMGTWRTESSVLAPWADPAAGFEANPEFASTEVVLTPTTSTGPGIVQCEQTKYEVITLGAPELFEGNLSKPVEQAAALGLTGDEWPVLREGCVSSTGDLELLFVLADKDTLKLGLDNIVYTLKRIAP